MEPGRRRPWPDTSRLPCREFLKRLRLPSARRPWAEAALGPSACWPKPPRLDAGDPYGQIHFPHPALNKSRRASARGVSLVKGDNRYDIVFRSLKLIKDEVLSSIGDKKVLIKPNIVLSDCAACVTHVDAMRAVLDFLAPIVKKARS